MRDPTDNVIKIWSKSNTLDEKPWRGLNGLRGPDDHHDSPGFFCLILYLFLGIPLFNELPDFDKIPEVVLPRKILDEELVDIPAYYKYISPDAKRRYEQLINGDPDVLPPTELPQGILIDLIFLYF